MEVQGDGETSGRKEEIIFAPQTRVLAPYSCPCRLLFRNFVLCLEVPVTVSCLLGPKGCFTEIHLA